MAFTIEELLLGASLLLFLSILISKNLGRFGIPALALFLGVGMLAGSEGLGGIYFDDFGAAQSLGTIALTIILFSGGLDTRWETTKPILWRGIALSTLGVFITAMLVGVFATYVMDFTLLEGLLLGAIVSSTDAAAVFSILRSSRIGLKNNLGPTLELESGSNDPMAYFLTVSFTFLLTSQGASIWELVPMFFLQMSIGAVAGFVMGKAMSWVINKIKLQQEGLYPALTLAMLLFTFSFTNLIKGNGFLAVYISAVLLGNSNKIKLQQEGLYPALTLAMLLFTFSFTNLIKGNGFLAVYISAVLLGNSNFLHKGSLTRFYDGLAWLMQIVMFLTLGLLVFPSHIVPVLGAGLLISLFLIFVARPISVFLGMSFFKATFKDKVYVSWVGLRGAVPIVFAMYPLLAGVEKAEMIFNIVFFIVLTSVMLQGTTLKLVADWLNLSEEDNSLRTYALGAERGYASKNSLVELEMGPGWRSIGKPIVELGLPRTALIVLIDRHGSFVTPNGSTVLEHDDKLMIMVENDQELERVREALQ